MSLQYHADFLAGPPSNMQAAGQLTYYQYMCQSVPPSTAKPVLWIQVILMRIRIRPLKKPGCRFDHALYKIL
jgi:hypothetical protein